jgi:hypothetical protein
VKRCQVWRSDVESLPQMSPQRWRHDSHSFEEAAGHAQKADLQCQCELERPIIRLKLPCPLIVRPAKSLLREEQLNLKANRPSAALVRCNNIVEGLNVGIHRLATEVHDLAASATHRDSPLIPRGRFPIRGDDGRAGKIMKTRGLGPRSLRTPVGPSARFM